MKNGIVVGDKEIEFIGDGSYSEGNGLEMSSRFTYDYSKKPQGITRRKREIAKTASVRFSFTSIECVQKIKKNVFDYTAILEQSVSNNCDLFWNGENRGKFAVISAQFSPVLDSVDIVSGCSVALTFTEAHISKKVVGTSGTKVKVRVL